jgi:hypothetical protein
MPVAIASVTNAAPQLPYYFYSQTIFLLPNPLGGVVSSPDLFSYLRLVLDRYFPRDFILHICTANYFQIPAFSHIIPILSFPMDFSI